MSTSIYSAVIGLIKESIFRIATVPTTEIHVRAEMWLDFRAKRITLLLLRIYWHKNWRRLHKNEDRNKNAIQYVVRVFFCRLHAAINALVVWFGGAIILQQNIFP